MRLLQDLNYKLPYVRQLQIVRIVTGAISLIPCLIVMAIYCLKKNVRAKFNNTMSFQLSISCFIQSCCYFIYYRERKDSELCHWQGTLLTTFFMMSLIFTTLIALIAYLLFLNPDLLDGKNNKRKIFFCLIPYVFGIIYGVNIWFFGWDYDTQKNNERISRPGPSLLCFFETNVFYIISFIIDIILLITNIVIIFLLMRKILKALKSEYNEDIFKYYFWILIKYIIVQFLVYFPLIVNGYEGIYSITKKNKNDDFRIGKPLWVFLRDILEGLAGFLFSAVYGFSPEVNAEIQKFFGKEVKASDEEFNTRDEKEIDMSIKVNDSNENNIF